MYLWVIIFSAYYPLFLLFPLSSLLSLVRIELFLLFSLLVQIFSSLHPVVKTTQRAFNIITVFFSSQIST